MASAGRLAAVAARLLAAGLLVAATTAGADVAQAAGPAAQPATPLLGSEGFRAHVRPFLDAHCVSCHGPERQKAGIRYDVIPAGFAVGDLPLWTLVHEQIAGGEMPPAKQPRPDAAATAAVLQWIVRQQAAAQRELGSGSRRRLNRRELAQTLVDLLGMPLVQIEESLPSDRGVLGFDTGSAGLQDASPAVSATMGVIARLLDIVAFLEEPKADPRALRVRFGAGPDPGKDQLGDKQLGIKLNATGGATTLPGRGWLLRPGYVLPRSTEDEPPVGLALALRDVPAGAAVRLRVEVASLAPPGLAHPTIELHVGEEIRLHEISAREGTPQVIEVVLPDLTGTLGDPGRRVVHLAINNRQVLPYDPVPGSPADAQARVRTSPAAERLRAPASWLLVSALEVELDHRHRWLPAEERARLGSGDAAAREVVARFAARAYRRPPTAAELARLDAFYQRQRAAGTGIDAAIRLTLRLALASGPARYLDAPAERDPQRGQYAIASRLSYALVGAPPDPQLLALAAAGRLRDGATLDAQVDRLLAGPRSARFLAAFTHMWLELEQPLRVAYDNPRKERYEPFIKDAMHAEPAEHVGELLRANAPAAELVVSSWAMRNDLLAYHYGGARIVGRAFRRVELPADDPRGGGLLGMAAIMSMTTSMGPNWPVYRGAWMLRHVLDDAPPPPPLEVPELDPEAPDNRGRTLREMLARHQADPLCASCHRAMDPLGFAFQNFDVSGRWRTNEHARYVSALSGFGADTWRGQGEPRPVDARGALPRGETFASFAEFRRLVRERYLDDVVRGLLKRYVLWFSGRQAGIDDRAEIAAIMDRLRPQGFPMRDLLKAMVRSRALLDH